MAEKGFICPVCDEKIGFLDGDFPQDGIEVHTRCLGEFFQDPEKYGGTVKTEAQIKAEKEAVEQRRKEQAERDEASLQEIKDKSVYVKDLDMPIKSMVIFMVKWAVASIPAFIILFIIFGILFLIFGSLFF